MSVVTATFLPGAEDSCGLYGTRISMLCQDVCGEDITRMLVVLRAYQLGIISQSVWHTTVDNRGSGLDVNDGSIAF